MKIKINKWNEWHGKRSEKTRCHWFKTSHFIISKFRHYGLTNDQLAIWLSILAECSIQNTETPSISVVSLSNSTVTSSNYVQTTLRQFKEIGWLSFYRTVLDKKRIDKIREEENIEHFEKKPLPAKAVAEFDFNSIYEKYPRKLGKKLGLKIATRVIRTKDQYEALSKAIDNYSNHCASENIETRFIKHFSTFMNQWEDYIDPLKESKNKTMETFWKNFLKEEKNGQEPISSRD